MTLLEQFDGFFLSYAADPGTPPMCVALPVSRNDFLWAPLTSKNGQAWHSPLTRSRGLTYCNLFYLPPIKDQENTTNCNPGSFYQSKIEKDYFDREMNSIASPNITFLSDPGIPGVRSMKQIEEARGDCRPQPCQFPPGAGQPDREHGASRPERASSCQSPCQGS